MSAEIFSGELEGMDLSAIAGAEMLQFLVFQAGDGTYGVNILDTHEILKPVRITRVPNVEPDMLGVLNLRGNIIPLMDTGRKFGESYSDITNLSRVVVCACGGKFLGLLVDRVIEVARISSDAVEGREVSGLSNRYVKGVGRSDSRLFLILNLDMLHSKGDQVG